ncbi:MAG TPA: hypothetical protein PLE30_02015 [Candidatus Kapabacteria bacterium]|nr:hypothetical protein [Candidatus Kapabacteria bacterium]
MNANSIIFIISLFFVFLSISNSFAKGKYHNKCGFNLSLDPNSIDELQRTLKLDQDRIPKVGQKQFVSNNNLFKIHYDTTGYNAPDLTDLDNNGTPDYIDSVAYYCEYAYNVQVNEIGYKSPIPDGGNRGSDHYDIYIWDLGNSDNPDTPQGEDYDQGGLYGLTLWNDKDAISFTPFQRTYSFMVLDNNYSPFDSVRLKNSNERYPAYKTNGIEALKITISHEFQHAIQCIYGISVPAPMTIMEMCGVAMEFRLFPESTDYLQYITKIFSNLSAYPFGVENKYTGYGFSIFAKYIMQNYGDGILKNMWELVGNNIELYRALDSSFTLNKLSFKNEWATFTKWAYFTGSRAIEGEYFSDAKKLPEIKFDRNLVYSKPSISSFRGTRPLEIGALRFQIKGTDHNSDDTLDILYSNNDAKSASQQIEIYRNYNYYLTEYNDNTYIPLKLINMFYKNLSDTNYIISQIIQRPGNITTNIDYAYPNPYNPNSNNMIYFPAPTNSKVYENATLVIFNTEMLPIISKKDKLSLNETKRVFSYENLDLQNGVYIYSVATSANYTIGKFTIVRK